MTFQIIFQSIQNLIDFDFLSFGNDEFQIAKRFARTVIQGGVSANSLGSLQNGINEGGVFGFHPNPHNLGAGEARVNAHPESLGDLRVRAKKSFRSFSP